MDQNTIGKVFLKYISSKKRIMKFIFGMQINIEVDSMILGVRSQACPKYLK